MRSAPSDRSLPSVMGELTGLEQVIINLVMNARDAGAHLVRIETSRTDDRKLKLDTPVAGLVASNSSPPSRSRTTMLRIAPWCRPRISRTR